jgi:glycosyltransferase involved in cell wall biosynthesis
LKIVLLLTQSLDSPSGLGRYGPLASQLVRLGHQVTILALHPDFSNLAQKTQVLDGVKVIYVSQMHVRKRGSTKSYFSIPALLFHAALATLRLSIAAARQQADIIHICKPHPMNGIAGWIAHHLHRSQLWLDCDDYEAASGRFQGSFQRKTVTWFERHLPPIVDHVTTNTHFMRQKLLSWGVAPGKITYLPNGVDPGRFTPPAVSTLQELRTELNLHGRKVVLYVGSLSLPSHPWPLLVEAFQIVLEENPAARLVIVGGGEDFAFLQKLVREQDLLPFVRICGRVPADQVAGYYHLADVSVEPVYDDDAARGRCPIKLFESWACGAPFVTADVGDRRSLLGDPPAGLLARPGDLTSLAEQILLLLTNTDFADEIRDRGLGRVKAYDWEKSAITLNQAYLSK